MKIRVDYTYVIEGEDLLDLQRYHGDEKLTRDIIRQNLEDHGRMGVEEQISQGSSMALDTD